MLVVLTAWGAHRFAGLQLDLLDGESMEPTFRSGASLALVKADPGQIQVGDIIAFRVPSMDIHVCHRVVEVLETRNGPGFITRGDANFEADGWIVLPQDIEGRVLFDASWLLPLINFSQNPTGMLVIRMIPPVALFGMAGRRLWLERRRRKVSLSKPVPQ